jgi:hypothetical protein
LREPRLGGEIEDLTPEYFREVLLSYRLIFGQNKASWTAFKKKIPAWGNRWNCSTGQGESTDPERDQQNDDSDPLLLTLCGSGYNLPNARRIYEEIEAIDDVAQYYHPHYEFPFFGRRLLILQSFVKGRHPHNWKALWHDTRNVAFWWTFWVCVRMKIITHALTDFFTGSPLHWRLHHFAWLSTDGISDLGQHIRTEADLVKLSTFLIYFVLYRHFFCVFRHIFPYQR